LNNKRRWKIGDFTLKINPKSNDKSYSNKGISEINANGIISASKPFIEKNIDLTIDVFNKKTNQILVSSHIADKFRSISDNSINDSLYALDITDSPKIHKLDKDGTVVATNTISYKDDLSGKTVTSSTGLNALNLLDNEVTSYWDMQTTSGNVVLDMGFHATINKITLKHKPISSSILIHSSLDNASYTSLYSGNISGSLESTSIDFATIDARYIKIEVSNLNSTNYLYLNGAESYLSPTVKPNGITCVNSNIFGFYPKQDNKPILYKFGEFGQEISKYICSDADANDVVSIAWDFAEHVYLLNKFGKVFKVNINDWTFSLVMTFGDFDSNKANAKEVYNHMIIYRKGKVTAIGIINNENSLFFIDIKSLEKIYSIDINKKYNLIDISYGTFSSQFFFILSDKLYELKPNLSKLDMENIKRELENGDAYLCDENGILHRFYVKSMSVKRKRNMEESIYEVSVNGSIL
jgi:hypothetical protein